MSAQRKRAAVERIGSLAAAEQDATRRGHDEAAGLERFRAAVDAGVVQPAAPRKSVWLAAAAAVLVAVALVTFWPKSRLTFALHGADATQLDPAHVDAAQWIDNRADVAASFSDGTEIAAKSGSRWRVAQTTPVGATVQLERGSLTANVRSREDTKWLVDAGPFSIVVTGTEFTTSWDPVAEVFELRMVEGTVVLGGPIVGSQRVVHAPEHLRIEVGQQKLAVVPPPVQSATVEAPPAPSPLVSAEPTTSATAVVASSTTTAPPKPRAWAELAQRGKYAEALALVQEMNAATLLSSESAGGLMLLAQTARLGGDQALAARALASLSKRHPNSVQAKTAQFLAGKLNFDRGRYAAAVTDLSAYLQAAPGGAFAGEAQVLLMLALHGAGRTAEARAMAGPYLERHPNGPHAARIRSILSP